MAYVYSMTVSPENAHKSIGIIFKFETSDRPGEPVNVVEYKEMAIGGEDLNLGFVVPLSSVILAMIAIIKDALIHNKPIEVESVDFIHPPLYFKRPISVKIIASV
jgi:hypothetical protein